jgi:hypothetical protein
LFPTKEDTVRLSLAALILFVGSATLSAQGRGLRPRQQPGGDSAVPARANLERQVRQRIAMVTRQRLGASDDQMAKLEATNRKYDEKRRLIVELERDLRMSLRDEMLRADPARQEQVAALLDRVNSAQRQRMDINEQEQKELAGFLTPMQRAKYFALEQQVRQRMQQMRNGLQGRAGRGRGQPPALQQGRARGVQPPVPGQ